MKPFVVYTVLRILLFAATWGIVLGVWALVAGSANVFASVIVAFVISGIGSYVVLSGPRSRFAERVEQRADRMVSRFDDLRAREDDEEREAEAGGSVELAASEDVEK